MDTGTETNLHMARSQTLLARGLDLCDSRAAQHGSPLPESKNRRPPQTEQCKLRVRHQAMLCTILSY